MDSATTGPATAAAAPTGASPHRGSTGAPRTEAGVYRPDIDGLRAVAVLSVLAFHAFPQWMRGGFIGVDERPAEVVLSAYWPSYPWERLPATIDRLLAAGVGRVLVVGPGPLWPSGLAGILYARAKADVPAHRIPRRLPTGADAQQSAFDRRFAAAIARPGVDYVSMLSILCNASGCLTRTREDASSIMFYDIYHMTTEGSTYAVAHFPDGALPKSP